MKRRKFLNSTLAASASTAFLGALSNLGSAAAPKHTFKLNYAPHFNMFKNLGGKDPIDQLKFAADQGFTSYAKEGYVKPCFGFTKPPRFCKSVGKMCKSYILIEFW